MNETLNTLRHIRSIYNLKGETQGWVGGGKGIGHKQEGGFMHTWRRQQHAKKRKENQAMLIASG